MESRRKEGKKSDIRGSRTVQDRRPISALAHKVLQKFQTTSKNRAKSTVQISRRFNARRRLHLNTENQYRPVVSGPIVAQHYKCVLESALREGGDVGIHRQGQAGASGFGSRSFFSAGCLAYAAFTVPPSRPSNPLRT